MTRSAVRRFFLPDLNKRFLFRILLLTCTCWLVFTYLLIPLRIEGRSMEPTYMDNTFAFCWRLQYRFSEPERSDVVTIRYAGRKVMLLKRIIGLAGDTIEFREGVLYVNGKLFPEPYVHHKSSWNLPLRKVRPNNVYVIGDNRGIDMSRHLFGQLNKERIVGGVVL